MAKEIIYDHDLVVGDEKDFHLQSDLRKIKLGKKLYINKTTNEFIDRAFSEFFKSEGSINIEDFFIVYRDLFYKIPKEGKFSHHYLKKDQLQLP